ncbi:hypothetical protein R5W23_004600 [Gemmata sp. JC673]|uniref:Uncharacterized protein n=1 Tax=Gemmata algarum TaxID=2975278 RepID=A0ABU5F6Y0_9BACT|nr:hypothetical protein [Gemmata algarum]MDY3563101.1 hypothetical protein [Gemmata algarum]
MYITPGVAGGEAMCFELGIIRRPGGRVPDGPYDGTGKFELKMSTTRNAAQCAEETIAGKWAPRLLAGLRK